VTAHDDVHRAAIVIDGVCPLLRKPRFVDWYIEGGATAATPTVSLDEPVNVTLECIGRWLRLIAADDRLVLAKSATDIDAAKSANRLAIVMHFQGPGAIAKELDRIDAFKALGVGMIQLTYNVKNALGDGACERTDAGLSKFGIEFVKRCNEARVIVDCSHTGTRTTLDAFDATSRPAVFSHANPKALYDSPRNITDEQIRAAAATGGLIGAVGFPGFLGPDTRPTLDRFVDQIDYLVETAGIDHVGLGIDYYTGQHLVADEEKAMARYRWSVECGRWDAAVYPPPPHHFPDGIETPQTLSNLTEKLIQRGYSTEDTKKVLGENWLRVFRDVWGD
jgi:membrane dipeptidase